MGTAQETSASNLSFDLDDIKEDYSQYFATDYQFGLGSGGRNRSAALRRARQVEHISPSSLVNSVSSEHEKYMRMLDKKPALVLNADYQPIRLLPLSLWHWQEVVKAYFSGKVTAVAVYPDIKIRAANKEVPLPSVIALKEYVPLPNTVPQFTKHNVFLRDEHRCQYCGNRFQVRDLSLDHVTPRWMGGMLEWDNVVTSCRHCNAKKGPLRVSQLHQVGMSLIREPFTPTQYQLYHNAGQLLPRNLHPTWIPYLEHFDASTSVSSSTHESASAF